MKSAAQCAEIVERTYQNMAYLILFTALTTLIDSLSLFASGDTQEILRYVTRGFAILTVLAGLRSVWFMRKKVQLGRKRVAEQESFVLGVFKEATSKSWVAAFVFLAILGNFSIDLPAEETKEFVVSATMAVMLGTFSLIFFFKNRGDKDFPEEDFAS